MNMENSRFKFRLWCNNKKEWEKDKWHLTPDGRVIDSQRNIEMKKETHFLMQYTGLKDIYNVPIYEGDVLRTIEDENNRNFQVIFKDGCFVTDIDNEPLSDWNTNSYVIGNIYRNPELLN